jgi:hypothetical protein
MSDLGERWIAPYWQRILVPAQDPELEHYMTPAVAVVNPRSGCRERHSPVPDPGREAVVGNRAKDPPHQSWNEFGPDDKATTISPAGSTFSAINQWHRGDRLLTSPAIRLQYA